MANGFSSIWFDTFLSPTSAAPVQRELDFIRKHLSVAEFPKLLDVPCGIGRHAGPLSSLGYDVVGVDRSADALDVARRTHPGADYRLLDMNDLDKIESDFDGVLCLWQSFGFGSAEQNLDTLRSMAGRLREGGRLLLDVYNAEALTRLPAESTEHRSGRTVTTRRTLDGGRFRVRIRYSGSSEVDVHDWMVYTPSALKQAAGLAGLTPLLVCAWFDEAVPASAEHQRLQLLCVRHGAFQGNRQ